MEEFERAFARTEQAALAGIKACSALSSAAKQLQKAAQEGDISKIRRMSDKLDQAGQAARQEIANAVSAWPFSPDQEQDYLRNGFVQELLARAASEGLRITQGEDHLIAFPSLVRVLPKETAVQVNRKKVFSVRPTRLISILKESQNDKPRYAPEKFIEALFAAYSLIVAPQDRGRAAKLEEVYRALTLLPGSNREYDTADFTRDLFFLDRAGISRTKGGLRLSLPAATGTKGGQKTFPFVAPDGAVVTYYAISFREEDSGRLDLSHSLGNVP